MKNLLLLILILFLSSCEDNGQNSISTNANEAIDITDSFSCMDFELVNYFILKNGDNQSISSLYGCTLYYAFPQFEVYLYPESPQNSNCEPIISDFNQLVIRDQDNDPQYFHIQIIRKGDLKNKEVFYTVPDWAVEERVFLINPYDEDIEDLKNGVMNYLTTIKKIPI